MLNVLVGVSTMSKMTNASNFLIYFNLQRRTLVTQDLAVDSNFVIQPSKCP